MKNKSVVLILLLTALLTMFSADVFAETPTAPVAPTVAPASAPTQASPNTIEAIKNQVMAEVNNAAGNETANLQVGAAIIADPITKNVIYEKNSNQKMYPASITKLMSFVIIYEGINSGKFKLTDPVTISPTVEAVNEGDIKLKAGEIWQLQELLYAMSIISANDASVAVAEYAAGSEAQYAEMMNAKATELGMKNTHFMNCTGLHDENHYTTAHDLFTLACHAVEIPQLLALTSTQKHVFNLSTGQVTLNCTNKVLDWYPGADGLKTGFTTPAGHCLAATAVKDNMRLISIVLGCPAKYGHYSETMKLLNYGFSKYALKDVVTANTTVATIDLPKGKTENIKVCPQDTITLPTAKEGDSGYKVSCKMDSQIVAPVQKGDIIGKVFITANGKEIATTPMVAAESIDKENIFQSAYRGVRDFFRKITT
ncbi:MAG: D-alanyl-D-alanine carboxypeptidase family protein [Clostridiales bacterium]